MIQKKEIIQHFQKLGLKSGDLVLVHSSWYRALDRDVKSPKEIIDALLEVVGEKGTIIFPTFNFDFSTYGKDFDVINTLSEMGILTNLALKYYVSIRTLDPVYSFAIIGFMRNELGNITYSNSYGSNSMFARIKELDGKIMCIGIDDYDKWMTFFHHIEEMQQVPYRYLKRFSGNIIDENRIKKRIDIFLYVRKLEDGVKPELNQMGYILEKENIIKIVNIGKSKVRLMNSREVYDRTVKEMISNPCILMQYSKNNTS